MDDLGRYQAGDTLPLLLQCRDHAGTPDVPADNPVATVYTASATVAFRRRMPADLRGVATGLFRLPVLMPALTAGPFTVAFSWTDSHGNPRAETAVFSLIPGGGADGAAVALRSTRRPQATFLVRETEAGTFGLGKNPR